MRKIIGRVMGLLVAALVFGLAAGQYATAEGNGWRGCLQTHIKGKRIIFANVCAPADSFVLSWKDLADFVPAPLVE